MSNRRMSNVIQAINKYLSSIATLGPGGDYTIDRASIIEEVLQQVFPSISSVAQNIVRNEIQIAIENLLEALDLSGIVNTGKYEIISYRKTISSTNPISILTIPVDADIGGIDTTEGRIRVLLEGKEQILGESYNIGVDPSDNKTLTAILFEDELYYLDRITVEWERTGKNKYLRVEL
jgi:hypothetical protein